MGEGDELVRVLAHRRDDGDDTVPGSLGLDEARGDAADLLGVGDRGAAELHDEGARGGGRLGRLDGGDGLEGRLAHGSQCPT